MTPETETAATGREVALNQPQRYDVAGQDPMSLIGTTHAAERDQMILLRAKLDYAQRLAKMFAFSGCFADIKDQREDVSIARALVKIKLGESMGFTEAEAMTGIDIIQGRVAVGASLRAARMQRAGYSWPQMIVNDKGCWIPLAFQGAPMMQQKVDERGQAVFDQGKPVMTQVVVSFDLKDAQLAGLAGKDNYKKDPSSMYFARAITRAQRRYGPGVLGVDILDTYEARDIAAEAAPAMIGSETADTHDARLDRQMAEQALEEEKRQAQEPERATPASVAPGAIWADMNEMTAAFMGMREALGDAEFWVILGASGISFDDEMQLGNPATVAAYNELRAAVAAKAPKEDKPKLVFGGNKNRTR